jgi:D-alanyl-D-alanine endopeptidase (penicillin-binding protein 7)
VLRVIALLMVLTATARADGPRLDSPSAIAIDAATGDVVFARRADEVRPIASMTKLFAALVLRARKLDLSKSTTITHDDAVAGAGGAPTMLLEGQRFRNSDLLYAMMLSSDNRTPTALARSVGLSPDDLLVAMRKRAADLGLSSTKLADVTGISGNASTARDMALALRDAIRDPVLRAYMTTKRAHVASESNTVSGDYTSTVPALWTRHQILGGKTGWTEDAGYCQVVAVKLGTRTLVMAFLGARARDARFDDFVALVDFISSRMEPPDRAPASPRRASAAR